MSTDNPCFPRRPFDTESHARMAALHIAETKKVERHPVECNRCGKWHLSAAPGAPPSVVDKVASQYDAADPKVELERLLVALDVALNGKDGRASHPKLCDLVAQVEKVARDVNSPVLEYVKWTLS